MAKKRINLALQGGRAAAEATIENHRDSLNGRGTVDLFDTYNQAALPGSTCSI